MSPKRFDVLFGTIFVFSVLFIIYVVSFTGIPSSDDEQLFAVTTRNLVALNHFDAEPLYGNLRIAGDYHGVEPAFPLLASFWYRLMKLFNIGHLQSLYLLPIFYVSLSASILVLLTVQLGFAINLAVEVSLLYGLSTIVWPYAKTFFREPFILLLVLLSWLFFECMRVESGKINKKFSLLFYLTILLLCFTKIVYGILLLPYIVLFFYQLQQIDDAGRRRIKTFLLVLAAFVIVLFLSTFWLQPLLQKSVFYRFSTSFLLDVWTRLISGTHADIGTVLTVSLFSTWKGFFLYSPLCSLIFFMPFLKKTYAQKLLLIPLFVLFALLIEQWVIYDTQWWNPTWASRVLLPVVPLILVACMPAYEFLRRHTYGKFLLLFIAFWGFVIQWNAIVVNSSFYTTVLQEKVTDFPNSLFWNFSLSPMLNQWKAIYLDYPVDNFLLRLVGSENSSLGFLFLILGVISLISVIFIGFQYKNSILFSPKVSLFLLPIPSVLLLSAFLLVLKLDPFYRDWITPVEQACQITNASSLPDDLIVVKPYPSKFWYVFLNQDCIQKNWFSLPHDDDIPNKQTAQNLVFGLLDRLPSRTARIWLIQPVAPSDAADTNVNLLTELNQSVQLESEILVDQGSVSIQLYISKTH